MLLNCNYYHYFDNDNNYHCTINSSCPENYQKLIKDKMECVKFIKMENIFEDIIKIKPEHNDTEKMTKEMEIEYYDTILENIEKGFTSENYDTKDLDNGKDEIIETEKMKITFTTTENQKNKENENMTHIDLGECEIKLR